MPDVRMGKQGRVVIPAELRAELGAEEGAVYVARVEGDALVLEPKATVIRRLQEQFAATEATNGQDGSVVEELLAQRRADAERGA